jgi:SAM-dependent methyltransferase
MSLHTFDLLLDFQEHPEWQNAFDLVNQRLMFLAWTPSQWAQICQNYFSVLKPGGYLQFIEFDSSAKDNWNFGPHCSKACEWGLRISEQRGIQRDIVEDLPQMLEQAGFEICSNEVYNADFGRELMEGEKEPFPGAKGYWYRKSAYAYAQTPRDMGLISDEEWNQFEEGIKDEWETADRSDWAHKTYVIVARVSISIFFAL